MANFTNLVLTDRKPTPVAHTFTTRDVVNGVATVVESAGIPLGDSRVSLSMNRTNGSNRYKPVMKFIVPVLQTETINGVSRPVVVRTAYAELQFNFDATSTEQERKDLVGYVYSALGTSQTMVNEVLVGLQGIH